MERLPSNLFSGYKSGSTGVDELVDQHGCVRETQKWFYEYLSQINIETLSGYQKKATSNLEKSGVYFNLVQNATKKNRTFPFDVIPRVLPKELWATLQKGLEQRIVALNLFLEDVYGKQKILKQNSELKLAVNSSPKYLSQLCGFLPSSQHYLHVSGIDVILDENNDPKVLEDNLQIPSGVSFAMKNRNISRKLFPNLFLNKKIHSIEQYPLRLRMLLELLSKDLEGKTVVLTPGVHNCAYFEHSYLAKKMGCRLVEGIDLLVENKKVYVRTENGLERVKAIYRRIEDTYLDPNYFNPNSLLGVKDLVEAYLSKNVILANGIGTGVADDKTIYPFVPEMIQYYLSERPILNQIKTYSCLYEKQKNYVIKNINKLVIKTANGSGGYDVFMGMTSSKLEQNKIRSAIEKNPRNFIAQPRVELSNHPTYINNKLLPKRVDFRSFVLGGESPWVLPGGLTRVALKHNSYIVNSSQGGGSKDTWVMEE
jgi:uncharacterized circularly permuted ATP-grasp superfamily protein